MADFLATLPKKLLFFFFDIPFRPSFIIQDMYDIFVFICQRNSDHIMPYRLQSIIFSDRVKFFFFLVLLASHNPKQQ